MALAASNLLRNRIVAITGASQGIGRGIAVGCAQAGARVVVHHLGSDGARKDARGLVREIEEIRRDSGGLTGEEREGPAAIEVAGDIADPSTADEIVRAAVSTYGRIDGLVSNAGICPFFSFLDIPHDVWRKTRSVNLDGAFYVVQAVAKQMKEQQPQGGAIVAVSSISALVGGGEQAHYTPTKAGVKSLMESCAISLSPYKIRCNSVLPGTIETPINAEDLSNPEKRAHMEKRIPLGRLGRPEDMAGPTVFLLSEMAQYVTGTSVLVDGGAFVNLQ
ncbi:SDR family NAD(P)-dependent oxidoreductase [Rhodotorula paludigena]|uniref:SDR family NAD(P)-dependent oxidoreductase n=1 Tax=Rhodotorula paludigena TaxID=86838 RepID=UPI0031812ADC